MCVNSSPKTITRQRRRCELNPGPTVPECSTLTNRLPSHPRLREGCRYLRWWCSGREQVLGQMSGGHLFRIFILLIDASHERRARESRTLAVRRCGVSLSDECSSAPSSKCHLRQRCGGGALMLGRRCGSRWSRDTAAAALLPSAAPASHVTSSHN